MDPATLQQHQHSVELTPGLSSEVWSWSKFNNHNVHVDWLPDWLKSLSTSLWTPWHWFFLLPLYFIPTETYVNIYFLVQFCTFIWISFECCSLSVVRQLCFSEYKWKQYSRNKRERDGPVESRTFPESLFFSFPSAVSFSQLLIWLILSCVFFSDLNSSAVLNFVLTSFHIFQKKLAGFLEEKHFQKQTYSKSKCEDKPERNSKKPRVRNHKPLYRLLIWQQDGKEEKDDQVKLERIDSCWRVKGRGGRGHVRGSESGKGSRSCWRNQNARICSEWANITTG